MANSPLSGTADLRQSSLGQEMERGEGGSGRRWAKGAGKGREAARLRVYSYLHFGAFPFDFNYLLGEPVDFKGDEFSITDTFSRIKGDWNLH